MAESTIISWNATNWITILLMAFLGFVFLGFIVRVVQSKRAVAA